MTAAETSVLSQQKKAQVQSWLTKVPVPSKNIKFGPKWVQNRRFGPKQRPNESYGLSGPIRTTPEAKNGQKIRLFKENGPRRTPADLGGPRFIGAPPVWGPMQGSWDNLTHYWRMLVKQDTVKFGLSSLSGASNLPRLTWKHKRKFTWATQMPSWYK